MTDYDVMMTDYDVMMTDYDVMMTDYDVMTISNVSRIAQSHDSTCKTSTCKVSSLSNVVPHPTIAGYATGSRGWLETVASQWGVVKACIQL